MLAGNVLKEQVITNINEESVIEYNIIAIIEKIEMFKQMFENQFCKEPKTIFIPGIIWEKISDKAMRFLQWDVINDFMYHKFCSLDLQIDDTESYIIIK